MNEHPLLAQLAQFAGPFTSGSNQSPEDLMAFRSNIAQALLQQQPLEQLQPSFNFETIQTLATQHLQIHDLEQMNTVLQTAEENPQQDTIRVFKRQVPVINPQILGSVPEWGRGAAVDRTIGPLIDNLGRQSWLDLYKVINAVQLLLEGNAQPMLLLSLKIGKLLSIFQNHKDYSIPKSSIWINAHLLTPGAPADEYCGLTISSGKIHFSNDVELNNGKMIVPAGTTVTITLNLLEQSDTSVSPDDTGIDAKNSDIQLPSTLSFSFSSAGFQILTAGDAAWKIYEQKDKFSYDKTKANTYFGDQHRVIIPYLSSEPNFDASNCISRICQIRGFAPINKSAWSLSCAKIDITHPLEAKGIGAMMIIMGKGLAAKWIGLKDVNLQEDEWIALRTPLLLAEPGNISFTDIKAGNSNAKQQYKLWKNTSGAWNSINLQYTNDFLFFYNTLQMGIEAVMAVADCMGTIDTPVNVAGKPFALKSKKTVFVLTWTKPLQLVYLYDDNLLSDNAGFQKMVTFKPEAVGLNNALLTVSPVTGFIFIGDLKSEDELKYGILIETFGLIGYLPTLPDPYAADLGPFRDVYRSYEGYKKYGGIPISSIRQLLVCIMNWHGHQPPDVNFIWGDITTPVLQSDFQVLQDAPPPVPTVPFSMVAHQELAAHRTEFASVRESEVLNQQYRKAGLLQTVETNPSVIKTAETDPSAGTDSSFRVKMEDSPASKLFSGGAASTVNEEPLTGSATGDQPIANQQKVGVLEVSPGSSTGFGLASRGNSGLRQNGLFSLLDVSTNADLLGVNVGFINDQFIFGETFKVLPIDGNKNPLSIRGMDVVATSRFARIFTVPQISWEPVVNLTVPPNAIKDPPFGILRYDNDGFASLIGNTGVGLVPLAPIPLTNITIDQYNKDVNFKAWSLFTLPNGMLSIGRYNQSNHYLPKPNSDGAKLALIQANFDNGVDAGLQIVTKAGINPDENNKVFEGYTRQEFNVSSVFDPGKKWSILGKTVTDIFNLEFSASAIIDRGIPVERYDFTGYGAQVFSHWLNNNAEIAQVSQSIFDIWRGRVAKEIIQVRSIIYPWAIRVVRTVTMYRGSNGFEYRVDSGWRADSDGVYDFKTKDEPGVNYIFHPGLVRGVFKVRNIIENNLAPYNTKWHKTTGKYVDPNDGKAIPVGAGVDLDVQLIPVYFDADVFITDVDGSAKVSGIPQGQFVPSKKMLGYLQVAPRGIIISDQDFANLLDLQNGLGGPVDTLVDVNGSGQKMRVSRVEVNHSRNEANQLVFVTAAKGMPVLPKDGSWSLVWHNKTSKEVLPLTDTTVSLIRKGVLGSPDDVLNSSRPKEITPASELFKPATDRLVQFAFLQNTDTQKVLYRNPFFNPGEALLHTTKPDLGDAYRLLNSKGVFPNLDNLPSIDLDGAGCATKIIEKGYQMVDKAATNVLKGLTQKFPSDASFTFINKPGILKVYVEYANTDKDGNSAGDGGLDLDLDSLQNKWVNKMSNVTMVVDLVTMKRLFLIQGKFNTQKGSSPKFDGPKLIPGKDLKPIIEILEVLEAIGSSPDYSTLVKKGLQIAMSNSPNNWEYKFQADKEIPVLQFPPAYLDGPTTPLRLEANMKLGVYFNLAVPVPPNGAPGLSAGGFIEFGAKLSVMCVSLAAATVYAVGQVTLRISADTVTGPGLYMKMGFGIELMVGIPVVGNVSVYFAVGIEVSLDTTQITIGAFILFRGEASLIGGLVTITIQIEASGKVKRTLAGPDKRTDCIAQVTFSIDVSILFVIDIHDTEQWQEARQIA